MMVAARDRRAIAYAGLLCETLSILLIALTIIAPLPLWARVFIVVALSYVATLRGAGTAEADLRKDEALENLWINHLTLRLGVDAMLEQVQAGDRPVSIDWRAASAAAVEDIKSARMDEKIRGELAGSFMIEIILSPAFLIGWLGLRLALGWGLSIGLLVVFPTLAHS